MNDRKDRKDGRGTLPRELVEALGDLLGDVLAADLKAHPEDPPQRRKTC